jgi:hypothetical protein
MMYHPCWPVRAVGAILGQWLPRLTDGTRDGGRPYRGATRAPGSGDLLGACPRIDCTYCRDAGLLCEEAGGSEER